MAIAFFDMDKTLLSKSSGVEYVKFLAQRGMISRREMLGVFFVSAQYSLNLMDFPKAMARLNARVKGGDAQATRALCETFFRQDLIHTIAPAAVARAKKHVADGDEVIVLSASTQFVVLPVSDYLGFAARYTELEIVDNHFTGRIVSEPCYGEGKVYWAKRMAQERGVALSDCAFYTDSHSDRPLMELVGRPVAVNPDRKLLALAKDRGWQIEKFY